MSKTINFLGLGIEVGQGQTGLCESPSYARQFFSSLKSMGFKIQDKGDIIAKGAGEIKLHQQTDFKKLEVKAFKEAYLRVKELLQDNTQLLNWGGDHSVGLSTAGAFLASHPEGYILWIDAHADLNLPNVSPTGNFHGMPLAVLLNLQQVKSQYFPWLETELKPERLIYVGLREIDAFERQMIDNLGITAFSMLDVQKQGMNAILWQIIEKVKGEALHVSFDIDSINPELAPSTGVPVQGGINLQEMQTLAQGLARSAQVKSVDIVEVNPKIGKDHEVFETYKVALLFLKQIFNPGGSHESIGRTNQAHNSAALESGSQI